MPYPVSGVYTTEEHNGISSYPSNGGYDCGECWKDCIETEVAEHDGPISWPQYAIVGSTWIGGTPISGRHYRNTRPWARFDLSGLDPDTVGNGAYLRSQGGHIVSPSYGVAVRMHDGSHLVGAASDYGAIADGTFLGGTLVRTPFGLSYTTPWSVHFNEAGRDFLRSKAGGNCVIGFIADTYPYPPPGCPGSGYGRQSLYVYYDSTKCYIMTGDLGGYLWVEGDCLAYLNYFRTKMLCLGSIVSGTGDSGYPWVEGNYLCYMDSIGNKRSILGTLTGRNTGKIPGQISINYAQAGIMLGYIDSSGNERAYEGVPQE